MKRVRSTKASADPMPDWFVKLYKETEFDESDDWPEDYRELRKWYLAPSVVENATLGGGMSLRNQTRPPRIDLPEYKALKKFIKQREREGKHKDIYVLFKKLRAHDIDPFREDFPRFKHDDEVQVWVGNTTTTDNKDVEIINVDDNDSNDDDEMEDAAKPAAAAPSKVKKDPVTEEENDSDDDSPYENDDESASDESVLEQDAAAAKKSPRPAAAAKKSPRPAAAAKKSRAQVEHAAPPSTESTSAAVVADKQRQPVAVDASTKSQKEPAGGRTDGILEKQQQGVASLQKQPPAAAAAAAAATATATATATDAVVAEETNNNDNDNDNNSRTTSNKLSRTSHVQESQPAKKSSTIDVTTTGGNNGNSGTTTATRNNSNGNVQALAGMAGARQKSNTGPVVKEIQTVSSEFDNYDRQIVDKECFSVVRHVTSKSFYPAAADAEWKKACKANRDKYIIPTALGDVMRSKMAELQKLLAVSGDEVDEVDKKILEVLKWATKVSRNPDKPPDWQLTDLVVVARYLCGNDLVLLGTLAIFILEAIFADNIPVSAYRGVYDGLGWRHHKTSDKKEWNAPLLADLLGIEDALATKWIHSHDKSKWIHSYDKKTWDDRTSNLPKSIAALISPRMCLHHPVTTKTTDETLVVFAATVLNDDSASAKDDVVPKLFCSLLKDNSIANRRRIASALETEFPRYQNAFQEVEQQYERSVLGEGVGAVEAASTQPSTVTSSQPSTVSSTHPLFGFVSQAQNHFIRKQMRVYDRIPTLKATLVQASADPIQQVMTAHEMVRSGKRWRMDDFCICKFLDTRTGSNGCVVLAYLQKNPEYIATIKLATVQRKNLVHDVVVPLNCHSMVDYHSNVAKLFGYFVEEIVDDPDVVLVGIIMELCNGDLKTTRVKKEDEFNGYRGTVSKKEKIHWVATTIRQIIASLVVLQVHGLELTHRDLKPQNVLEGKDGLLKLTYFGFAGEHGVGDTTYKAPELRTSSDFGTPADVWSAGAILFELITGVTPNKNCLEEAIQELPSEDDKDWKALVVLCKRMLCVKPAERITAAAAAKLLEDMV